MITVVGDVHGKYDEYYNIASKCKYSICLGDFGFSREWTKLGYSNLDPINHKICLGNHDDHDIAYHSPYNLGGYGIYEIDNKLIFFVSGGLSIDRVYRVGEELSGGPKTW